MIEVSYYKTRIGELILGTSDDKLCLLDFRSRRMRITVDRRLQKATESIFVKRENVLLIQAKKQVDEYLTGQRKTFDLPLITFGTELQKDVWAALLDIVYGETVTYLNLAKHIGNEKAVRAVASANGANALALVIPCHRVIGSNGDLMGYGGGLPIKKRLLKMEKEQTLLTNEQRYEFLGSKEKKIRSSIHHCCKDHWHLLPSFMLCQKTKQRECCLFRRQ